MNATIERTETLLPGAIANIAPPTVDQLAQLWIDAKDSEDRAKARRVSIEEQIVAKLGAKEEGAQTHKLPSGFKVEISGKLTYKADMQVLEPLLAELPEGMRPIKTVLDETGAKWLRLNEPETWKKIADAITVKPAKVGVKVSV